MRRLIQPVHEIDDALIFGLAGVAQLVEASNRIGIQPVRRIALAGQTPHPDPVGHQEMIERAMDGFKERAAISAIFARC